MKQILLAVLFIGFNLHAQTLSTPDPQEVYGGTVLSMDMADWGSSTRELYFSTESANSLFHAEGYYVGGQIQFDSVTPVPSADEDDGFGSGIFQVHCANNSAGVYFLANGYVYYTSMTATSATQLLGPGVESFTIENSTLLALMNSSSPTGNDSIVHGTVTSTGAFVPGGGFSVLTPFVGPVQLLRDPTNNHLYVYGISNLSQAFVLVHVAEDMFSFSSSPSVSSAVNPYPNDPNIFWTRYGIAPNGDWYVAGQPNFNAPPSTDKKVAYSSDNGTTWTSHGFSLPGPPGGTPGANFQFVGSGSSFGVYIGRAYSPAQGDTGTWVELGNMYREGGIHPNDGMVLVDPASPSNAIITTDLGLGISRSDADSIFGLNQGLAAVQVNGLDMTPSFATGWVASKSGVRKVENYKSGTPLWSGALYPNGDGSPYYSVCIDPGDSNTVYVGNSRVYKTTNSGASWTLLFDPTIGGMHGSTFNFPMFGSEVTGISVSPANSNIVVVTYSLFHTNNGGVFLSIDGGNSWSQVPIVASGLGQDVDVTDVVAVDEGAGKTSFYVSLLADPFVSGYNGIYRIFGDASGWSTTPETGFTPTSSILELELSTTGDSILALFQTSSAINPPVRVYIKDLASGAWSYFNGPNGQSPTAIANGAGYVFLAQAHEIYAHPIDSIMAPWTLAYSYPVGTRIEEMFFDELLVGTGTGLYAQDFSNNISIVEHSAGSVSVYPNPTAGILHWDEYDNVRVTSLSGLKVLEWENVNEVDLSALPVGIYFLIGERIGTHKIIVNP